MGIVARHMESVRASETKVMTARAAALRAEGKSIIILSQGEPDFDTPDHVRAAGHQAIDGGFTRYTAVPGTVALREAIAAKLHRDNGLSVSVDQIVVGCGAKQVIFNALFASLDPGDEVVIPAPCWVSYPEMVRLAGGAPVVVSTVATGFKLTASALESALTERTKWLVLNSPCNPTGVVYSATELHALAEVLEHWPMVWVLSDDIYEKLVYDATTFVTMAAVAPRLASRTLTVNGLSKSHAMTGWRVGYGAGPQEIVKAISLIQSQTTSHTSSISQHAAAEALNGDDGFLEQFREEYRVRRDIVIESLNAVPGLNALKPDGAFYIFVSCAGLIGARAPSGRSIETDVDLAVYFLEEAGVAVVPGRGFLASPFFRVSYAAATLVHSKQKTPLEIERFVAAWDDESPLAVVPTTYPQLTEALIKETGRIGMVIYGNHGIRAAVKAMRDVFAKIARVGHAMDVESSIATVEDIFAIQEMDRINDEERRFVR